MAYKKLKYWFDQELAESLATKISERDIEFKSEPFIENVVSGLNKLELKDRIEKFADALFRAYEENYINGLKILVQILGPENKEETGMFAEYYWIMPIAKYVEKYGLENFDSSMGAIEEITKRNTGEYAIRPYIELHFDKTLKKMSEWSIHSNNHIRRLASEGLRPRLPWAKKLATFIDDPSPIIPILEELKNDSSKYVQKSVANCINDILKDNYEIGKTIIENWNSTDITKQRKWIIKHALRNLVKSGNEWAISITK